MMQLIHSRSDAECYVQCIACEANGNEEPDVLEAVHADRLVSASYAMISEFVFCERVKERS